MTDVWAAMVVFGVLSSALLIGVAYVSIRGLRELEETQREALAYETVPCWRCGRQRYTYESCHHCGGSCKPLTRREQEEADQS